MSFERSNVRIVLITVLIGVLICVGIVVYGTHKKERSVTFKREEMLEHAHKFYMEGDVKKAVSQMEYYCLNRDDVFDEEIELAGWYKELGDEVNSTKAYRLAVEMADYSDNDISVKEPFYHVDSDKISFTIEPVVGFTKGMELIFKGEDITPEGYDTGKVNGIRDELTDDKGCRTTPWMEVDKSKGSVILTGDMNCAIWQFMNANGEITNIEDLYYEEDDEEVTDEEGENVLCSIGSIELTNRSYSKMEIPEDAVKCRVTYADESIDGRSFSDNRGIIMFYGKMLQGYSDSGASSCVLPDLTTGQSIVYDNGNWSLYVNGSYMQDLDIDPPAIYDGAGIFMQGEICGKVIVNEKSERTVGNKDAEYGIEFSVNRGLSVGRRLGDAVGMHFDYCADNEMVGGSGNDFDLAYPWSEMKLCNIVDGEEGTRIVYQGEAGYADDGSNGNVMVEIPRFYVKRIQNDDIEQIWISGTEHDGYVLDPVFIDNGEEKEYVYVGAYQGVVEDDILLSKSGVYPSVNLTYDDMRRMARSNGEGYRALGYNMYSALQKLFLVETGCLDSTSLMAGEQDLYYYSQVKDYNNKNTAIAIQSVQASNKIVVNDFYATQKFEEGGSVVFLNVSDGWEALEKAGGPNGTDKVEIKKRDEDEEENEIEGGACREITSVETDGGHIEINFDGDPIDIRAGETVIASYPSRTGKTKDITYCTGYLVSNNGRHGFKYRNIENLYGSEMTMLGADAYIKNGIFCFIDGYGEEQELNEYIPEQNMGLDGGISEHNNTNDICIKKMSFDADNPTIMIPVEYGASVYSYYGDYYYYKSSDDKKEYYLAVGDPMNAKRAGGLFEMRAIIDSEDFARYYCGGRIMFR